MPVTLRHPGEYASLGAKGCGCCRVECIHVELPALSCFSLRGGSAFEPSTDATRHFATFGLAPAAAQVLWCLVRAEEQGHQI